MNKKLLIQAYKYPPVQSPASIRLLHFHTQLMPFFQDISIQTSDNYLFFNKDKELSPPISNVQIITTKDLRKRRFYQKKSSTYLSLKEKQPLYFKYFLKLYHSFPFVYFTGDGGHTYIRESYKKAVKLVEEDGITHILTSYRPWADHIVAYRLKKRFPHLVWIADFRDLAIDPVRKDVWWPWLQKQFQKRLLKKADIVTTVSNGLARRLKPYAKQVIVVRNGLSKLPPMMMTAPLSAQFTISYSGSLYPNLQSTEMLFQCLRSLLNEGLINPAHLQLQYAGKDGDLWQEWAAKHTLSYLSINHGLISIKEARGLQRNSQINLLLSWSAENYGGIMTAKLADYLMAARPIIAILNGPEDPEFNQLIKATGGGYVYPSHSSSSPQKLRTFLLDAYRTWQFSGALPWQTNSNKLKPYTWTEQVKKLIEVL